MTHQNYVTAAVSLMVCIARVPAMDIDAIATTMVNLYKSAEKDGLDKFAICNEATKIFKDMPLPEAQPFSIADRFGF